MEGAKRSPFAVNPVLRHESERRQALDGEWLFRLDPEDRGIDERWFDDPAALTDRVRVPGCWQGQGRGGDGVDRVWDFRLEARVFRATYRGAGWYGRTFRPAPAWKGERIWIGVGGVHPSAELWLNGHRLGEHGQPFVPFSLEAGEALDWDGENYLAVRVHERDRAMGMAFNWQGAWSGLYRGVDLTATGDRWIEHLAVIPDPTTGIVRIRARIGGRAAEGEPAEPVLTVEVRSLPGGSSDAPIASRSLPVTGAGLEGVLSVPSPRPWSPDNPALYRIDACLTSGGRIQDAETARVGFVRLSTSGKHVLINGDPYYLRGSGEFLSNPETGSPDTDRDRWRRKLATLRRYGYNYVRCQSFVPAPEYYDAADEVGLLVQSEMGVLGAWGGSDQWHIYAWPQPSPGVREAIKDQWDRVVERDVNHPSAGIYCMSNELGKQTDYPRLAWQCYRDTKAVRPHGLVLWTDGGCNDELPGDFVNDEASVDGATARPVVQHEFRWWSSYPDVRAMPSYDGAVRPYGAEIAIQAAARHGIAHVLPMAAETSQRLQLIEAKAKMERCRRDAATLAGICHFNAMDANPSPQGVVDEHYRPKHASAEQWLETNGDTVVLCSLGFSDRVLRGPSEISVAFSVSDFSHPPLSEPVCAWELLDGDSVLARGGGPFVHEPYRTCPVGTWMVAVPRVERPTRLRLIASLRDARRTVRNTWDLWDFPPEGSMPPGIRLRGEPRHTWLTTLRGVPPWSGAGASAPAPDTSQLVLTEVLDSELVRFLRDGGRVILCASEGLVRPFRPKFGYTEGHYFFTPPANYPPYEDGHDGTIIQRHAMLGGFPHEGFADFQLFRLIEKAPPIELEPLGMGRVDPVIRVLHSYPVARPLAYLAEARVGRGCLILSALHLDQALPEARYLLEAMAAYGCRAELGPAHILEESAIAFLTRATA